MHLSLWYQEPSSRDNLNESQNLSYCPTDKHLNFKKKLC